MEYKILKFDTNIGRLWIAGTCGVSKRPFSKRIIQDIEIMGNIEELVTLTNKMSYPLRIAATLLRGLMLIYDKQWMYLESDADLLFARFREQFVSYNKTDKQITAIKRSKRGIIDMISIDSSMISSFDTSDHNFENSGDLMLSLDPSNLMLDIYKSSKNKNILAKIEDITLPQIYDENNNQVLANMKDNNISKWMTGNDDFIFHEDELQTNILENVENNKNKILSIEDKKQTDIKVVREKQKRQQSTSQGPNKRIRSLSNLDINIAYKDLIELGKNQKCSVSINPIFLKEFKGWDINQWWHIDTFKVEKEHNMMLFSHLNTKSTRHRVSTINMDSTTEPYYPTIEKHRGSMKQADLELGFEIFDEDSMIDFPNHINRQSRGSINSLDLPNIYNSRESFSCSNGRESGVRLSVLDTGSRSLSVDSSPFHLDLDDTRLRHRNLSIESDMPGIDENRTSTWSRSGLTTSSGTYNLKTYTVQKFISVKLKEVKQLNEINNGEFQRDEEITSVCFKELLPYQVTSRNTAATFFYHILVLASYNELKLFQKSPGSDIEISRPTSFINEDS
ncbi:uncharacterized protein CMU_024920 [Cryptosporidium muris RN66]|uniref:Rad21/Rec8-like protein N-terminal domain-containing protein n=1 Tax=Cryptosporidium muris (strain RN66) TaxID=441375 RepID=B6AAT4_CRYMR|nr:uncharacterized protein CMU_024920 [Cryptosporidium muris RN66]EEA05486.1 hypothetical protein, conserved [Cryptosporidium muris RN66]|eukprot:XP_002139835.1 hypothetical protein [Cryptosporidium muris RN66]